MRKTKIDWADYSWNPIKGLCPKGCWYCYARRAYQRFKWGDFLRIDYKELDTTFPKKPSRIFVCSTMELFHPDIEDQWRKIIFDRIRRYPEHDFIVLTKKPDYINEEIPGNVWLGVTITGQKDIWRWDYISHLTQARVLGRLTGHGQDLDPRIEWLVELVKYYQENQIPVFIKDNLAYLSRGPWTGIIQEYPKREKNV